MKFTHRIAWIIFLLAINCSTVSALAQPKGVGAVTIRYATISPIMALVAGILILVVPRLLNFIVAVYLILVGLVGLFGV